MIKIKVVNRDETRDTVVLGLRVEMCKSALSDPIKDWGSYASWGRSFTHNVVEALLEAIRQWNNKGK